MSVHPFLKRVVETFIEMSMKSKTQLASTLSALLAISVLLPALATNRIDSRLPRYAPAYVPDQNSGRSIEPKNLPGLLQHWWLQWCPSRPFR